MSSDWSVVVPGVECKAAARKLFKECALLLTSNLISDSGDYGVQVSENTIILIMIIMRLISPGVSVVSSLVWAAELFWWNTTVLQVLRVSAGAEAAGLSPPGLTWQRTGQADNIIVCRQTRETETKHVKIMSYDAVVYLVSARHSSSQSLLLGTCSTILSSKPSSFLLGTLSKAQLLSLQLSTAPRRQIFSK